MLFVVQSIKFPIHFYVSRVMKLLEMSQVGRYYYDPTRPCPIPQHRLELWPGYITSIQAYEGLLQAIVIVFLDVDQKPSKGGVDK